MTMYLCCRGVTWQVQPGDTYPRLLRQLLLGLCGGSNVIEEDDGKQDQGVPFLQPGVGTG